MGIRDDVLGPTRRAPINSKNKGNRNEQAVARWLTRWTGKEFVRTPQSGGIRWRNSLGLNICGDVVCTEQGHYFPFTVETKHLKDISFRVGKNGCLREDSRVLTIFEQVNADSTRDGKRPLMLLRCNGMGKDTWWVFLENDNHTWDVLQGSEEVHPIYTSDKSLIGIHSVEFTKEFTYDWVCAALDGRGL